MKDSKSDKTGLVYPKRYRVTHKVLALRKPIMRPGSDFESIVSALHTQLQTRDALVLDMDSRSPVEGIAAVAEEQKAQLLGTACPYCGNQFQPSDAFLICPYCRTAHHRECWNLNRGCTTLGCTYNAPR